MDRESLIAGLQDAFRNDSKIEDDGRTEFKHQTNSLLINDQLKEFQPVDQGEIKPMSEEELFERLRNQRR